MLKIVYKFLVKISKLKKFWKIKHPKVLGPNNFSVFLSFNKCNCKLKEKTSKHWVTYINLVFIYFNLKDSVL